MIDHPDYFRYKFWFMNDKFETVSDVVGRLIKSGYATEFHISKEVERDPLCSTLNRKDFVIDEAFFFAKDLGAGQDILIMAVSSRKYKVKGILINGFASNTTEKLTVWSSVKKMVRDLFAGRPNSFAV